HQRVAQVWSQEDEVAARPEDATHLDEHVERIREVLEHPDRYDDVKRVAREGQVLRHRADHRHPYCPVAGQRRHVGIDPGGKPHVAPYDLGDSAPPAAEVEHVAVASYVTPHD